MSRACSRCGYPGGADFTHVCQYGGVLEGPPPTTLKEVPMFEAQTLETTYAAVGTIEVRIRSEEYASDEAIYLCTERIDGLQALCDTLNAWGVQIDGNTYSGQGAVSGQFAIGKHGAFFEIIVSTEVA